MFSINIQFLMKLWHNSGKNLAGPAALGQEAESIPSKIDATDENGGNSELRKIDDENDSRISGEVLPCPEDQKKD